MSIKFEKNGSALIKLHVDKLFNLTSKPFWNLNLVIHEYVLEKAPPIPKE